MKSTAFISVVIFLCLLPKLSSGKCPFWRCGPAPPPLPSDPNAPIYKKLQKIPSPQTTAKKILDNFIFKNHHKKVTKRTVKEEDIVFILDGSGSVGKCEFDQGKKALKTAMEACDNTLISCRHAGISFASSATVNFNFLPTHKAKQKMDAIPYTGGTTNTQAALEEARKLIKTGSHRWENVKVLLVTDGQSNVKPRLTIPNAQKIKDMSVKIFVVAVGSYISGIDEMAKVASYPPDQHVFRVQKNSDLEYVFKLALEKIAPNKYKAKKKPSPC